MFLLFFLIFVFIFTVFQNILVAGISLSLVIVFLVIYQVISDKKMLGTKILFSLFGWFLVAGLAFGIKERKYSSRSVDEERIFIGTGNISDVPGQGKYIFSDGNHEFLLRSEKRYAIGDQLRLVGNLQTDPIPSWHSYRTIASWTFAVPIFSWGFDYPKRMKMKWRQGTIFETNAILLDKDTSGFIKSAKKAIQERTIAAYGENKISGLVLGMLIGDKSQIPEEEYQQFIDSGLVHLVAVSGGNILMIVVFLQFALFFLPFYVRIGLILVTITGYSLICGLDSSVFRAVLMGGLSMVALFRGREIATWRLLSISALIMLMINPYFLAYDTGFLLSYSAIIGLVYFDSIHKSLEKKQNRIAKWFRYVYKSYVSPSIWASIGIFPIIIFFMGQINLVSILGNLLVLPIVPFVMIYGFVSVRLHPFFGGWRILRIEQILVRYIYGVSGILAERWIFLQISWMWVKYMILLVFAGIFITWKTKKGESERQIPQKPPLTI